MVAPQQIRHLLIATGSAALLVAAGAIVLPEALPAGKLLLAEQAPETIVDYRLRAVPAGQYVTAIEAALVDDDPELADSLLGLADARGVALPAELRQRVAEAQGFHIDRSLRETWKGLSGGEAASPEALAGAVTADLSGITDVRDIVREGSAYLNDEAYDPLILGLAAAGLTATGAMVLSMGVSSPARVGVTAIKVASKAGTLRQPMRRALVTLTTDLIDGPALRQSMALLKGGDITAARAALGKSVRAAPLKSLTTMTTELGSVAKSRGYRSAYDVLKVADGPAEVVKLGTLSARLGPKFRGVLKLLGAGAVTLAGLMLTIGGWVGAAAVWLLGAGYLLYRLLRFGLRLGGRTAKLLPR